MLAETGGGAMARPWTKPVQPAWTSKAPALMAPILSATIDAVAGVMWSGEIVVTMTRSTSAGSSAPDSRQRRAATSPRSLAASSTRAMRRSRMPVRGARISALGVHVPERVLTHDEISQFLDTSDEWTLTRTGIRARRIARVDEAASDLGGVAARRCLESGALDPAEVDLVIVTTISPDHITPCL